MRFPAVSLRFLSGGRVDQLGFETDAAAFQLFLRGGENRLERLHLLRRFERPDRKNQPDILVWTCSRPLNRKDRFWKSLNAVQSGQIIYAPDSSLLLRPGPRLPDGIELLKKEMEKFR